MLPGRLTRWKGGLDFVAAIAALGRRDICCVMVGATQRRSFRRELDAAIERYRLGGLFRIIEDCRDMPAAYMLADVVVSASTEPEGFGRVIVEAQAMGRPVVATDHGGARETIVPGVTGWLVPARDPAALAHGIAGALSLTPAERARLAQQAIAHVAEHFTRQQMCAKTIAVYEELLFPGAANTRQSRNAAGVGERDDRRWRFRSSKAPRRRLSCARLTFLLTFHQFGALLHLNRLGLTP